MPTYETVFITVPILTDQEEQQLVETMAAVVTDGGGSFTANERMGRRRLAYPIRKFEDGVYTKFLYDSGTDVPKELDRRFRLSDKVLRHLSIRLEPEWAEAAKTQAVKDAQARAEAEESRKAAMAAAAEARKAAAAEKAAAEAEAAADGAEPAEKEPATEGEATKTETAKAQPAAESASDE